MTSVILVNTGSIPVTRASGRHSGDTYFALRVTSCEPNTDRLSAPKLAGVAQSVERLSNETEGRGFDSRSSTPVGDNFAHTQNVGWAGAVRLSLPGWRATIKRIGICSGILSPSTDGFAGACDFAHPELCDEPKVIGYPVKE